MSDWLGVLTKNGLETWPTYTDTRSNERCYPPKAKDGESKADLLAAFLKAGEKFIEVGEDSRYKVEIDDVGMFFTDEVLAILPPAGTLGFFNVTSFYSAKSKQRYFSLVGMGDAEMALAQLSVLAKRQNSAATAALEEVIYS